VSTTSAISSSPMQGGENGKKLFRILESNLASAPCCFEARNFPTAPAGRF
jgi:hypothetical protein